MRLTGQEIRRRALLDIARHDPAERLAMALLGDDHEAIRRVQAFFMQYRGYWRCSETAVIGSCG